MSTDLTTVRDHPARLLDEDAAGVLRDYEATNDVTFAALDNDVLANVREFYEGVRVFRHDESQRVYVLEYLAGAVSELLGLED